MSQAFTNRTLKQHSIITSRAAVHACLLSRFSQSCPTLCDPMDCSPLGSSVHRIIQAGILELGCHALRQGIFLTQGSNLPLLHLLQWQVVLYH